MIKVIIVSAVLLLGGCASTGPNYSEFMEECLSTPEMTHIKCVYTAYNAAVTDVNSVVKDKHEKQVISTKTKEAYKAKIIELNGLADEAYAAGNLDGINTQQGAIHILRQLLLKGLGPSDEAQL